MPPLPTGWTKDRPRYKSLVDMLNRTCPHLFPWKDRPAEPQSDAEQTVDLPSLFGDINFDHIAGRAEFRRGIEHFHRCGLKLLAARAEVKRRREKWGPYRKQYLAFTERRAQRYQALAKYDVTSDLVAAWRQICGNDKRRSIGPNRNTVKPVAGAPKPDANPVDDASPSSVTPEPITPLVPSHAKPTATNEPTNPVVIGPPSTTPAQEPIAETGDDADANPAMEKELAKDRTKHTQPFHLLLAVEKMGRFKEMTALLAKKFESTTHDEIFRAVEDRYNRAINGIGSEGEMADEA